ncbi:hypothetical protein [Beijerinckia sp. L45]|uniref:DUF6894 family protein n=1 Tax=Beijerinckia sp. L45 TaxID=1641855 RepID=UPI00131E388D|nr:hypothetical protein [Beijerinckia sp. L45]
MPRYFFHVKDGDTSLDHDGVVFSSVEEAKSQALETMGEILRDEGRNPWTAETWRMHVMDEDGKTVCQLYFAGNSKSTGKTEPFAATELLP